MNTRQLKSILSLGIFLVAIGAFAQTQLALFTTITNFPASVSLATTPILGADGTLYVVSEKGGYYNYGAIYKINRDGSGFVDLHDFTPSEVTGTIGQSILQGQDGRLYGSSLNGGADELGLIFALNTDGTGWTNLYTFSNADDAYPIRLIQGSDGMLYGLDWGDGFGLSVFKLDTNGGNYSVICTHSDSTNVQNATVTTPAFTLIQADDGWLYGTGLFVNTNGYGTIFKLKTDGSGYAELCQLRSPNPDLREAIANLMEASDGSLYGMTMNDGMATNGTIFKINRDGSGYTVLHSFGLTSGDGEEILNSEAAYAPLAESPDQIFLYGSTPEGGTNGYGTIFEIGRDGGDYQILHNFQPDQTSKPYGLLLGPAAGGGNNVLYGFGGSGLQDALFSLSTTNPPLSITPATGTSGGQLAVFWPVWAVNYQLQVTTNPASGNWVNLSNAVPITGAQVTNNLPAAYYRLQWKN